MWRTPSPLQESSDQASHLITQLQQKQDDLENHMRRNNLRFIGLAEDMEGNNPATFLEDLLVPTRPFHNPLWWSVYIGCLPKSHLKERHRGSSLPNSSGVKTVTLCSAWPERRATYLYITIRSWHFQIPLRKSRGNSANLHANLLPLLATFPLESEDPACYPTLTFILAVCFAEGNALLL